MKRSLLCLFLVLCLTLCACTGNSSNPAVDAIPNSVEPDSAATLPGENYADAELARAVALGFGEYKDGDPTITYAEFFKMLDRTVELADPAKLAEWQGMLPDARKSGEKMSRMNAAVVVYAAAETLDGDFAKLFMGWNNIMDFTVDRWESRDTDVSSDVFGDYPWKKVMRDTPLGLFIYGFTRDAAAYNLSLGKISTFSNKPVFEYDQEKKSMRPGEVLTYSEAILAALRLYDSTPRVSERKLTDLDNEILAKADVRRDAIIGSPTAVEISGKKYYVSESGNDANNGRTPQTAWKTTDKVNDSGERGLLKPGDGVFFERGGLWRGRLKATNGVTYSAYGEGSKPKIYGSPENGSGGEKWSLWYDNDGKKIWKFHRELTECGGIVFNEGESYALRVLSWWDGTGHFTGDALGDEAMKRPFDMIENLRYDLQFYTTFASIGDHVYPYMPLMVDTRGPVYLRCDKGNPGELYESIEFISSTLADPQFDGLASARDAKSVTIDNFCFKYDNTGGINFYGGEDCTVQNCEVGWIGGAILYIDKNPPFSTGETIRLEGTNNKAINNYVYQSMGGGITLEFNSNGRKLEYGYCDNMQACGNLIEYCSTGLMINDNMPGAGLSSTYGNILLEDNYVLYSGYGWSSDPRYNGIVNFMDLYSIDGCAFNFVPQDSAKLEDFANDGIYVRDNIFYIATSALIKFAAKGKFAPAFSGNTYVQRDNGIISLRINDYGISSAMMIPYCAISDEKAREAVMVIGDSTAVIAPVSEAAHTK